MDIIELNIWPILLDGYLELFYQDLTDLNIKYEKRYDKGLLAVREIDANDFNLLRLTNKHWRFVQHEDSSANFYHVEYVYGE